jgi:hypothetical protein
MASEMAHELGVLGLGELLGLLLRKVFGDADADQGIVIV